MCGTYIRPAQAAEDDTRGWGGGHTPSRENCILLTCSIFLAGNRREEAMATTFKTTRIEYRLGLEDPAGGGARAAFVGTPHHTFGFRG